MKAEIKDEFIINAYTRVMLIAQNICLRPQWEQQRRGARDSVKLGSYTQSSSLRIRSETLDI